MKGTANESEKESHRCVFADRVGKRRRDSLIMESRGTYRVLPRDFRPLSLNSRKELLYFSMNIQLFNLFAKHKAFLESTYPV